MFYRRPYINYLCILQSFLLKLIPLKNYCILKYKTVKKGMTRVGRRLIEDFLLPALNDERYGDRLMWVDKDKQLFSIRWSHKNAAKWSHADTVVFQDWDRMKGHFHPEVKGYYMQSKQRFRAALYKLSTVRKLQTENKHTKLYQLVLENDKRKGHIYAEKVKKEVLDQASRPSVICRNTNYIKRNSDSSLDSIIKEEKPILVEQCNLTTRNEIPIPQVPKDMYSVISCDSLNSSSDQSSDYYKVNTPTQEIHSSKYDIAQTMIKLSQVKSNIKSEPNFIPLSSCVPFVCDKMIIKQEEIKQTETLEKSNNLIPSSKSTTETFCSSKSSPYQQQFKQNSSLKPHIPVNPIPVYDKATIQPRKIDQPVDLSIKRERYENSYIPVSAR